LKKEEKKESPPPPWRRSSTGSASSKAAPWHEPEEKKRRVDNWFDISSCQIEWHCKKTFCEQVEYADSFNKCVRSLDMLGWKHGRQGFRINRQIHHVAKHEQNTCQSNGTMTCGFISRSSCLHEVITSLLEHVSDWFHISSSWSEECARIELIFEKSIRLFSQHGLGYCTSKNMISWNLIHAWIPLALSCHITTRSKSWACWCKFDLNLWLPVKATDRLTNWTNGSTLVENWLSSIK
jgi:hypothetical protein